MRLKHLVIGFCMLASVSVASAIQAPIDPQVPADAHATTTMEAHPGFTLDAAVEVDGPVTSEADPSVSLEAPDVMPWAQAGSPCPTECSDETAAPASTPAPRRGAAPQVLHAVQDSPPAVWWSMGILAIGSLGTKIWWFGPGRFTWLAGQVLRWGLAVPLWTRIKSGYALENQNRLRIMEYVADHPGASIQEVQQAAGVAWGTAVYHLERLERVGKLVGHRGGNHHRYWANGTPEARLRRGWALLEQDTAREVALAVARNPGIHQGAICDAAGIRAPSASKHLSRLEQGGLVEKTRVSRFAVYEPTEQLQEILARQADPAS